MSFTATKVQIIQNEGPKIIINRPWHFRTKISLKLAKVKNINDHMKDLTEKFRTRYTASSFSHILSLLGEVL